MSGPRSGMGQNEPLTGGVAIPANIEDPREEGREERALSDQGSSEMNPVDRISLVMRNMQRLKDDCERLTREAGRSHEHGAEEAKKRAADLEARNVELLLRMDSL